MRQLRGYQVKGLETLRRHSAAGRRLLLLTMPTGAGKTVVAGGLVKSAHDNGARVLFVAHRVELIDQAVRELEAWDVPSVGVMRADDERTDSAAIHQVASIQTLARRKLPAADIVIVDEAHRVMGDTYQRIIAAYPEADVIGLTATACRLDGRALGDTFEALVQFVSYSELIKDGSIVRPRVFSSRVLPDMTNVGTRQGDFALDDLDAVMTETAIVGSVVDEWKRYSEGRHSVVFACTINHSRALVDQFKGAGVRAEHLDGDTPLDVRRAILARLESGETEVVSNVGVLCEGWDQPSVKCISLARPTQSLTLYMQMSGRELRPWNDVIPILIDHGRNVDRHGYPHEDREWDLLTGSKPRERMKIRTCPNCYAYVTQNPCELCGHLTPVQERKAIVSDLRSMLQERTADPKLLDFERFLEKARTSGFKPGYAAAKFKEKHGNWPPWSWSERAKAGFAKDEAWQKRQAAREREAAFWKAHNAKSADLVECVDDVDDGSVGALVSRRLDVDREAK